jgi:hypothetical protein
MRSPELTTVFALLLGCGRTDMWPTLEYQDKGVQPEPGTMVAGSGSQGGRSSSAGGPSASGGAASGGTSVVGGQGGTTMTSGGSDGVAGAQGGNCASPESCDDDRTPLFNSFVTNGEQQFRDIAAANDGRIAIAIATWWDIDFGPPTRPLVARGNYDPVLAVFDARGTPVWSTILGDLMPQQVAGIAFDADGHLLATGNFQGSFFVGGQQLQASSEGVDAAPAARAGRVDGLRPGKGEQPSA